MGCSMSNETDLVKAAFGPLNKHDLAVFLAYTFFVFVLGLALGFFIF